MNIKQIIYTVILLTTSSFVIAGKYDFQSGNPTNLIDNKELNQFKSLIPALNFFEQQKTSSTKNKEHIEFFNLIKNAHFIAAESKINDFIKQHPKDPQIYNLQGLLEVNRKNSNLAIKSYQNSLKLDPQNIQAHIGLSRIYLVKNDLKLAKEYAKKVLTFNDKLVYTYFLLAEIATKENKPQEVENLLLTAQSKNRGDIKNEMNSAKNLIKHYLRQKQPEKTLLLAQDIVRRYPNISGAFSLLAETQLINKKTQQAIRTLEKIISMEKKDIQHRLMLTNILANKPENENYILRLFDEALNIEPDNIKVLSQKTFFLIRFKYFQKALITARKIKEIIPDLGLGYTLEAEVYLAEKKTKQAFQSYQKSYEIEPNSQVLNVIINIMVAQKRESDAIDFLSNEIKKNNKNLAAHYKLATIYILQNDVINTEKHYQAIIKEQPENTLVLNNLAWLYYQNNDPRALQLAEKAYGLAPKSAVVADTYGLVLAKKGELQKGIKLLKIASELAPNNYDIQYHLAKNYVIDNKLQQAFEILNVIIKPGKSFSEKNAALVLFNKIDKIE